MVQEWNLHIPIVSRLKDLMEKVDNRHKQMGISRRQKLKKCQVELTEKKKDPLIKLSDIQGLEDKNSRKRASTQDQVKAVPQMKVKAHLRMSVVCTRLSL